MKRSELKLYTLTEKGLVKVLDVNGMFSEWKFSVSKNNHLLRKGEKDSIYCDYQTCFDRDKINDDFGLILKTSSSLADLVDYEQVEKRRIGDQIFRHKVIIGYSKLSEEPVAYKDETGHWKTLF